jgi:hypothetical protein
MLFTPCGFSCCCAPSVLLLLFIIFLLFVAFVLFFLLSPIAAACDVVEFFV